MERQSIRKSTVPSPLHKEVCVNGETPKLATQLRVAMEKCFGFMCPQELVWGDVCLTQSVAPSNPVNPLPIRDSDSSLCAESGCSKRLATVLRCGPLYLVQDVLLVDWHKVSLFAANPCHPCSS